MGILLKNGKILDGNFLITKDILIEGSNIMEIKDDIHQENHQVFDLKGYFISPGFVDMHVHLREPGFEHKETIRTGTMAAARGGYTTICAMPNTNPTPDTIEDLKSIHSLIEKNAFINVLTYGAITKKLKDEGNDLVDFDALHQYVCGFTNDGYGVQSAKQMYEAMNLAYKYESLIAAHCEDEDLLYNGFVHKGIRSDKEGWRGLTSLSESIQIARDALISEETNCRYHVCHISTKEGVRIVRDAKLRGVNISAEVTPHHLLLTEFDVDNSNFKMNPPVRGIDDKYALISGLLDGTIDCVATDHAPHTQDEKEKGMEESPFGVIGLETAFPLLYTNLVKTNIATLNDIVNWFSLNPAKLLNLELGRLVEGRIADITVIDLNTKKAIDKNTFFSKGRNTPFDKWVCQGWPVMTISRGKIVYKDGKIYE